MNLKPKPPETRIHLIKGTLRTHVSYDEMRRRGVNKQTIRQETLANLARKAHPDCVSCKFVNLEEISDAKTMAVISDARCTQTACNKAQWSLRTGPIVLDQSLSKDEKEWLDYEYEPVPSHLLPRANADVPNVEGAGAW